MQEDGSPHSEWVYSCPIHFRHRSTSWRKAKEQGASDKPAVQFRSSAPMITQGIGNTGMAGTKRKQIEYVSEEHSGQRSMGYNHSAEWQGEPPLVSAGDHEKHWLRGQNETLRTRIGSLESALSSRCVQPTCSG